VSSVKGLRLKILKFVLDSEYKGKELRFRV
jgi:hypothetical protein